MATPRAIENCPNGRFQGILGFMNPVDYPPGTKKSVLSVIEDADAPVTAAQIVRALAGAKINGKKISTKQVVVMLAGDVDAGAVYLWGKAYWTRDSKALARERLLAAAGALPTKAELSTIAAEGEPKLQKALVNKIRDELLRAGRLREMPPAVGTKAKRILDAAHPEPFLEAEIAALLASFGIRRSAAQIQALLGGKIQSQVTGAGEAAELLFAAMTRLAFSPGASVTFQRLRLQPELAAVDKRTFDEAALTLQRQERVFLNDHGFAKAISDAEREQLVTDGFGNYYVSIYAR